MDFTDGRRQSNTSLFTFTFLWENVPRVVVVVSGQVYLSQKCVKKRHPQDSVLCFVCIKLSNPSLSQSRYRNRIPCVAFTLQSDECKI